MKYFMGEKNTCGEMYSDVESIKRTKCYPEQKLNPTNMARKIHHPDTVHACGSGRLAVFRVCVLCRPLVLCKQTVQKKMWSTGLTCLVGNVIAGLDTSKLREKEKKYSLY